MSFNKDSPSKTDSRSLQALNIETGKNISKEEMNKAMTESKSLPINKTELRKLSQDLDISMSNLSKKSKEFKPKTYEKLP